MNVETKICQNCRASFVIEPEDFSFYKKIDVPPPTFCPECRLWRRLAYRNERGLSKRSCSAPGHTEDVISIYSDPKLCVYDQKYWWSDEWDPMQYGKEYNFGKPFFQQFRELLERTPLISLIDSKSSNTSYCNLTVEHKNCYLVTAGWNNEDSCYCNRISFCKDTLDSHVCHKIEFGYENVYCRQSYQLFFSRNCESCNNSYFLYDCRGCSDCVCSMGLRNKQYYIFNQPYDKEAYFKKLEELDLHTSKGIDYLRAKFQEMYMDAIHKYAQILKSTNVVGDNIEEAKDLYWCFDIAGNAENSKYCNWATLGMKDCYDSGPGSGGNSELTYEGPSIGVNNARCSFGVAIWYSHDVHYSYNCDSCQYLFGCVSLRNKKYCILNKQYTKEEYEDLLPKIKEHMNEMPHISYGADRKAQIAYKYGEFFPMELSPFRYNDTIAQEFFPLTKTEAEEKHCSWNNSNRKNYANAKSSSNLPSSIAEVSNDITNEIIECEHAEHEGGCNEGCSLAFKIIPQELNFYRKFNLPLPRLCPNCRHVQRLKQRNPLRLWRRKCMCDGVQSANREMHVAYRNIAEHFHGSSKCPNEFETTFSPERNEIIYCEQCYNSEIV